MKKLLLCSAFLFVASISYAQEGVEIQELDVISMEVGSVFVLGEPITRGYSSIDFPRGNFVIKRGAIPNYNDLIGRKVILESIQTLPDGSTKVILKRGDGKNFFRFYPSVEADLEKALLSGELIVVQS